VILPVCVYLLFASTIIVNKVLLNVLPITLFVSLRMLCAGFILLAIAWRSCWAKRTQFKQDWIIVLFIAASTVLVPALLKAYGLKNMFASKVILLGCIDQVLTVVYAFLILNERLSIKKIIGIVVVLIGVFMLSITQSPQEKTQQMIWLFSSPVLAIFAYVAICRLGWINMQRLLKINRYASHELNAVAMVGGGIGLMCCDATNNLGYVSNLTWFHVGLFAYTILIGTVLGRTLYGYLLKKHSANFVTGAGFLESLFVTILSWLVLHEQMTTSFILSGLIIIAGVCFLYTEA
jgi:drug/metabolite transporter (DMT)-like permease